MVVAAFVVATVATSPLPASTAPTAQAKTLFVLAGRTFRQTGLTTPLHSREKVLGLFLVIRVCVALRWEIVGSDSCRWVIGTESHGCHVERQGTGVAPACYASLAHGNSCIVKQLYLWLSENPLH